VLYLDCYILIFPKRINTPNDTTLINPEDISSSMIMVRFKHQSSHAAFTSGSLSGALP